MANSLTNQMLKKGWPNYKWYLALGKILLKQIISNQMINEERDKKESKIYWFG